MHKQDALEFKKPGRIGIYFLREIWQYYQELRSSAKPSKQIDWKYINGVFNTLGIGTEPTIKYLLGNSPSFNDFEDWIEKNGNISKDMISYFNRIVARGEMHRYECEEKVFTGADIKHWQEKGYVLLKEAIPKEDCTASVQFICDKIGAKIADPATWYTSHPLKQGIMIQLFNAPMLDKNRLSRKIRLAFEQLWEKNNLIVSMDRVSFNPPETKGYHFPGPHLHWDVSLKRPIPFGMQGLLYLADTDKDQGAFTVIPGFHNTIEQWLMKLKPDVNPRTINLLDTFEEYPIAGQAGDLIIWNHALPHGSRPNTATLPRIVQYINYQPLDMPYQEEWV